MSTTSPPCVLFLCLPAALCDPDQRDGAAFEAEPDVAGRHARPDGFRLLVDEAPRPPLSPTH